MISIPGFPGFKFNLGGKINTDLLDFHVYEYGGSAKLDGIRAGNLGTGKMLSRTLKVLPNRHMQGILGDPILKGIDGELIVGSPTSPTVYRDTDSGIMSQDGEPDFTFFVFDDFTYPTWPFKDRHELLLDKVASLPPELAQYIKPIDVVILNSLEDLHTAENSSLNLGYEGLMVRRLDRPYKYGRSTPTERDQGLLKVKNMLSSEAVILETHPAMENLNEKGVDERGYSKRSSHRENKVAKDELGSIRVQDLVTGKIFSIGVFRGFTKDELRQLWAIRHQLPGKIVTYDYFGIGGYDLPRHPIMKGFRNKMDFTI